MNDVKLVLIPDRDNGDNYTLPLQVFCYTEDPVKVSIPLCMIKFHKKYIEVKYANEFRGDIFYAFLDISSPFDVLTKFPMENFSGKEGNKKTERVMRRRNKNSVHTIMQLRIAIKGIRPPVWRRLLVRSDTELHDLHLIIQSAFGWDNDHLYAFFDGLVYYRQPSDEWESRPDDVDSTVVAIEDLNLHEGSKFKYIYDFRDWWEHTISVEKILPLDSSIRVPACIGGKRKCPPEDCGGVYGYYDVIRKANTPDDHEHDATDEWLEEYNPEEFDLKYADSQVKGYKDVDNELI